MFSVKAFPGNCKVKKILALLSSFLISIFALNFLHKLFHSSGHGSPVFNEEKYYPPLCDEGEVRWKMKLFLTLPTYSRNDSIANVNETRSCCTIVHSETGIIVAQDL